MTKVQFIFVKLLIFKIEVITNYLTISFITSDSCSSVRHSLDVFIPYAYFGEVAWCNLSSRILLAQVGAFI